MSKLINELKKDHIKITGILYELKKNGATSAKGIESLLESKTALLAHLNKEDEQLYPPLYEKAQSDSPLRRRLDAFGTEMEKITEFVLDFYQKYSTNENIDESEFLHDVTTLIVALKDRIMKEEVAIFKAYEQLNID